MGEATTFDYVLREPTDSGFAPAKKCFAILSPDPIFSAWTSQLTDIIFQKLGDRIPWTSVNIVRWGFRENWHQNPACILITTAAEQNRSDKNNDDGVETHPELEHTILEPRHQSLGARWLQSTAASPVNPSASWGLYRIQVRFIHSDVLRYYSQSTVLKSGSTITCGGVKSGSLGGFIRETKNGVTSVHSLTCHHVATEGPRAVGSDHHVAVSHPSNSDHEREINSVKLALDRLDNSRPCLKLNDLSGPPSRKNSSVAT